MISIKDYAKSKNISYEAVRKQVNRYRAALDGHIEKQNRTQFLDDFAVKFLDDKRNSNPIIIMESSRDEEIEKLKEDNNVLLVRLAALQDKLIAEKERADALNDTIISLMDDIKDLQTEKYNLLEQRNQEVVCPAAQEPATTEDAETEKKHWWSKFF